MTQPPFLTADILASENVAHGFFSRMGGVSKGDFASLNTGPGSADAPRHVAENRRLCMQAIGVAQDSLVTAFQTHSPKVLIVEKTWSGAPAKADGLVTKTRGLAVGALAADCVPFLFLEPEAQIVAAAHAGWRGALAGVLENTVEAIVGLGGEVENICAAIGPCLRQPNFEIGRDLLTAFTEQFPESHRFFAPGATAEKRQFDLAGFGAWRLRNAGVTKTSDLNVCTLAEPNRYFSYRASKRMGAADYGRNLSAIALI